MCGGLKGDAFDVRVTVEFLVEMDAKDAEGLLWFLLVTLNCHRCGEVMSFPSSREVHHLIFFRRKFDPMALGPYHAFVVKLF